MNIEDVAATQPESIVKVFLNQEKGLTHSEALDIAKKIGFSSGTLKEAAQCMTNLYKLFKDRDSTMVEINPLAETNDGKGMLIIILEF